jgi:hypothetical protein
MAGRAGPAPKRRQNRLTGPARVVARLDGLVSVPERLRWAVALIGERLEGGCVTGIDRSATAIDAARRRNAELFYETPPGTEASRIAGTVAAVLNDHGLTATTTASAPRLICVTATNRG